MPARSEFRCRRPLDTSKAHGTFCGRPEGHTGKHISAEALARLARTRRMEPQQAAAVASGIDPEHAAEAALKVKARALDYADHRMLLEMLGLLGYQPGPFQSYQWGRAK